MEWIKLKLTEPSTYVGLVGFAALVGTSTGLFELTAEQQKATTEALVAILAAVLVYINQAKKPE
jgi:hypothetical protein